MADSFGLGMDSPAQDLNDHPKPVDGIAGPKRLDDDVTPRFVVEIFFYGLTIHNERAVIVQVYLDLGDGCLAFAGTVVVFLAGCCLNQN